MEEDPLASYDQRLIFDCYNMFCPEKQSIVFICTTENCSNNAFMCDHQNCACNKKHCQCTSKIALSQFVQNIKKRKKQIPESIKLTFDSIVKKFYDIIENVSLGRIQFIDFFGMFGLSEKTIHFIKNFNEGKTQNIDGKSIHQVVDQIKSQDKLFLPSLQALFEEIRTQFVNIQQKMNRISLQLTSPTQKQQLAKRLFGQDTKTVSISTENIHLEYIPVQISLFPQLQILDLSTNSIRFISNLASLDQLKQLYLNHNKIGKIQGLSTLKNLRILSLRNNQIRKIEGLDTLVALQKLLLCENQIKQIQGLYFALNLRQLLLYGNQISQIKNLDILTNLQQLWIFKNPLLDFQQQKNKIRKMEMSGILVYVRDMLQ